jgi:Ca2+-binding EF-hand superfamily protein
MAHTPPTPAQITAKIFKIFDTNGDGSITLSEVEGVLSAHIKHALNTAALTSLFNALDANHDGKISTAEVTAAITADLAAHKGHAPAHILHDNAHQLIAALGSALHHEGLI